MQIKSGDIVILRLGVSASLEVSLGLEKLKPEGI